MQSWQQFTSCSTQLITDFIPAFDMRRIADHSKALHGGSKWNVDSTIRSEFGWGSHTAHTAIVTYGDIHSHATVYASEDEILIILSSDPDYGSSYTTARNEDKYAIELTDITDVVIKREPSLLGRLHKAKMEVRRQSLFVFLKGGEACVIDTYDSDFSAKVVMMTWQANVARRSAGLGTLLNSEDHDMAAAYHKETITCLQKATKFSELVDILEDFSAEVLTDLELKDCTFKSRELIINCLQILTNLTSLPAVLRGERGKQTEVLPVYGNKARLAADAQRAAQSANLVAERMSRQVSRSSSKVSLANTADPLGSPFMQELESDASKKEAMSIEQEHKLKIIAVDRMKLIFCIFKLFSSLLFSSESLSSRFALLLGPSPLDLQSWLKYLIPDCYKLVCSALGCSETSTAAQVEAEIALSLQTEALVRSRANSFREGAVDLHDTHSSNNHSISNTPRRSMSMASVADGILTPLSARMRTIAESTAPDEYAEAMAQLTPLRQSVKDVQGMLTFDVHRIFGLAKAMVKGNHLNTNLDSSLTVVLGTPVAAGLQELRQINSVGDLYVRENFWEESLEEIVTRISGILQDMASSPHINTGPTTALSSSFALPSAHGSTSSLFGNQMRLNFTMMSNLHNFSTTSLNGVGVNGFVSPMVPPSPRSPPSSARSGNNHNNASTSTTTRPTRYRTTAAPSPLLMAAFTPQAPSPVTSFPPADSSSKVARPPFGAKKGQGSVFFSSSHNFSAHGIADDAFEHERRAVVSPLRTQEILLFYLATLLNSLCKDSYKVREVMTSDLSSYWRSIMGMMNILCPRPEQEEDSVVQDHVSNSLTTPLDHGFSSANMSFKMSSPSPAPASPTRRTRSGAASPRKRKANNNETEQEEKVDTPAGASSSKFVKKFLGMFVSTSNNNEEGPVMNDRRGMRPNASKKAKSVIKCLDEVAEQSAFLQQKADDERPVKIPSLYVFDYGKPKYGLSHASWTLLVLARMAIEDVIIRLNLDPKIILAKKVVQIDDQLLRDLGSTIGVTGMIAEGDSEDEYSVSHVDSEASMELGPAGLDSNSTNSSMILSDGDKPGKEAPFVVDSRFRTPDAARRASKAGIAGLLNIAVAPLEAPVSRNHTGALSPPQRSFSPTK